MDLVEFDPIARAANRMHSADDRGWCGEARAPRRSSSAGNIALRPAALAGEVAALTKSHPTRASDGHRAQHHAGRPRIEIEQSTTPGRLPPRPGRPIGRRLRIVQPRTRSPVPPGMTTASARVAPASVPERDMRDARQSQQWLIEQRQHGREILTRTCSEARNKACQPRDPEPPLVVEFSSTFRK